MYTDPTPRCWYDAPSRLSRPYSMMEKPHPGIIDEYLYDLKKKGYDMTVPPPNPKPKGFPYTMTPTSYLKRGSGPNEVIVEYVLGKINAQAEKDEKKYRVEEVVNEVASLEKTLDILTFNVKEIHTGEMRTVEAATGGDCPWCGLMELMEWRFKPASAQTCYPQVPDPPTPTPPPYPYRDSLDGEFPEWEENDELY